MQPESEKDLAEAIASAKGPLRITGGGTRDIGNPVLGEALSTSRLSGITLYEPGALTIVAQAGTPVADIETALDAENQRLAFEPMDHQRLLGTSGSPTIGGIVSANVSGSRRIAVGACRDHTLGIRFVDGAGTITKNGGRVMKNVTGYDLVKLLTGAYGTLGVLSEVSLKVLPKPETSATLILHGLSLTDSVAAMSAALGSPFEVTGAALHGTPETPRGTYSHGTQTCLRIEGFAASVSYRFGKLKDLLGSFGEVTRVDHKDSEALWRDITNVTSLADHPAVTRASIKPSDAAQLTSDLWQTLGADVVMDWGGGLVWFGMRGSDAQDMAGQFSAEATDDRQRGFGLIHSVLQDFVAPTGAHATLIKAPADVRAAVPVFQPENETVTTLTRGLRAKFDPRGILNPGLMG